jgi:hypothetical protein
MGLNVLTHSSESCFKTCPRKFELQYRIGLRPAHDSNALRIGNAFHEGLEVLKKGGDVTTAVGKVRDLYANESVPPWQTAEEFYTEEETAVTLVRAWAERWAGDHVLTYVAVELEFDLPLINPVTGRSSRTFVNRGKIDGIAKGPDGRLLLVEHKTCGIAIDIGADYWRKLAMDAQVSRYVLAARELGYDVHGIAYDVTRKPSIKPKDVTKKDAKEATATGHYFGYPLNGAECPAHETPKMYAARLLADMRSRPDFYFNRVEIPRTERDLDRFRHEQWMVAQQVHMADRQGHYYRNTNSCMSPYRCTYFDVCASGTDVNEHNIPAGFVVRDVLHPELATSANEAETHD